MFVEIKLVNMYTMTWLFLSKSFSSRDPRTSNKLDDVLAQPWGRKRDEIWHKDSLGDEDDARTSNTRIAQRKRAIPHSMKMHCNIVKSVLVTVLCNQPEAFASDLGDDQSRSSVVASCHGSPENVLFKAYRTV